MDKFNEIGRKLFFSEHDDEMCSTIDYWKDYMKENFVDKMILHLAERETGTDYFYCKKYFAVGEKGECGKSCDGYKPNNGKNGRCKNFGYCYDMTKTKFVLERVGEKFKVEQLPCRTK